MSVLLNITAYQIAWFACVLSAANQVPWIGTAVALAVVALHLAATSQRRIEIRLIVAAAVIGLALDSTLASAGLVSFASGTWIDGIAPHWMLGLWIAFATTLSISLRWLMTRPALAVVFGALGGPIAYYAGMKLGAMTIHSTGLALVVIGLSWAAAMGMLTVVVARADKPLVATERAA
jgi:hypothetical protein